MGAIHGTALCLENKPLIYMEDVGRHNAVDKVGDGYLVQKLTQKTKFYIQQGLTSEMVVKCANMGIPALVSWIYGVGSGVSKIN